MRVRCRNCDKANRLHKGIIGARCGACGKSLRWTPPPTEIRPN
jgi:hypothetical protein